MNLFASRPRSDAPTLAPHWILVRRMMVFALLLGLTSGLGVVFENVHASFTQALNSTVLRGPTIDWPILNPFGLANAVMARPLRIAFTDSAPSIDGNPEEAVWSLARAVEIHASTESNPAGAEVTVHVPALRWKLTLEN